MHRVRGTVSSRGLGTNAPSGNAPAAGRRLEEGVNVLRLFARTECAGLPGGGYPVSQSELPPEPALTGRGDAAVVTRNMAVISAAQLAVRALTFGYHALLARGSVRPFRWEDS